MTDTGPEQATRGAVEPASPWRKALQSRGLRLLFLVIVLGIAFATWFHVSGGAGALQDKLGHAAPLVLVGVIGIVSTTPLPSELIAIPMTGVYGFWLGALIIWVAWWLASFLQYYVARRTARDFNFEQARSRLPRWLRRFPVSHPAFLICARWFPWGPHLVNTAAGVFGVALVRHGWCAALSIVPQALVFSAVGNAIVRLW